MLARHDGVNPNPQVPRRKRYRDASLSALTPSGRRSSGCGVGGGSCAQIDIRFTSDKDGRLLGKKQWSAVAQQMDSALALAAAARPVKPVCEFLAWRART